ncbi:MAG: PHP domain-containing protein [Candidatus Limnocylindrales bacterium]
MPPGRRRHDPLATEGAVVPPSPSTIDLHTHTTRSDGVLEPGTLVATAFAAGVRILSLTDHDTLAGYREVVTAGGVPRGLTLIPGVEINALVTRDLGLWEGELHILGFGMDPNDAAFESAMAAQRDQRRVRFARTVDRLREIGLPIDEQVAVLTPGVDDALGRPTIARALIAARFAASVEDAFTRLIGHGMPGYVPRSGLGPTEAIAAIRGAGGVAVLAHFREAPQRPEVIAELVEAGLGGLEVYYRSFDQAAVDAVGRVAADLGLLATGGTDYHGDLGPYQESHAQLWVPTDVGRELLERLGLPTGP